MPCDTALSWRETALSIGSRIGTRCASGQVVFGSISLEMLHHAAVALGGTRRLAAYLKVPEEELAALMSRDEIPLAVFLASLDAIVDGHLLHGTTGRMEDRQENDRPA